MRLQLGSLLNFLLLLQLNIMTIKCIDMCFLVSEDFKLGEMIFAHHLYIFCTSLFLNQLLDL
jgi:hypothetical protein